MSSADFNNTRPDMPDNLLPLGMFSPRQEAVSYLMRTGLPNHLLLKFDGLQLARLCCAVSEHAIKLPGLQDATWQQTWSERITEVKIQDDGTILFTLTCASCKGPAVFTAEGPNDEYPEPLCEKCEAGEGE